jgi:hypothetical protein
MKLPLDLQNALADYIAAKTPAEEANAYYRILLFGGADGFPPTSSAWRAFVARKLRQWALLIESR